jgi:hypothetical protein
MPVPGRSAFEAEFDGILLTGLETFTTGGAVGGSLRLFVYEFGDGRTGAGFDTVLALSASRTINSYPSRGDFLAEPG